MSGLSVILTVASRDVLKLLRDRMRLAISIFTPLAFIGLMGGSLQGNLGRAAGFDFIGFIFTGVLGMTVFQSAASGLVSLIQDRENDFSQEMFVAPISRYSIAFGKVLGETLVAFVQVVPILVVAVVLRVSLTPVELLLLVPASLMAGLMGGAFGLVAMSLIENQRAAQQMFPFLVFPQFFLAGVFSPVKVLPWWLSALSLISPMRYAVDLERDVAYAGRADYARVVLFGPELNLAVMAAMFVVFLVIGTWLFVRRETSR